MVKSNNSSRDEEDYSCELPNFELKFFVGTRPKKFANLEWAGAESAGWTKALGTRGQPKKWSVSTFRGM